MILAAVVVELLLPPDAAILLAIDETLTRRRGPKVFAASWWHDGSAAGATKIGYGKCADLMVMPIRRVDRLVGRGSASVGSA